MYCLGQEPLRELTILRLPTVAMKAFFKSLTVGIALMIMITVCRSNRLGYALAKLK